MPTNCSYLLEHKGTKTDPLHLNTDNTDWSNVTSHNGIFGYSWLSSLYLKDIGINDPTPEPTYVSSNNWYIGYNVGVVGDSVIDNANMLGFTYACFGATSDISNNVIYANCTLPQSGLNSYFMGSSSGDYSYSNVIFHNVNAKNTTDFGPFYYKRGGNVDLRGMYNTQNITDLSVFGRGYGHSDYYKPIWIIFGDQFDTSSVTNWNSFLSYGGAYDGQIKLYLGHDNFKFDNPDADYKGFLMYARATTIYSDINETTDLPANKFEYVLHYNDFLTGQEGTKEVSGPSSDPLYKRSSELYKYYKVDGGIDDPGFLTETSKADLPSEPSVLYAESMQKIRNEWATEFADFSHKGYMTPLSSASGSNLVSGDDIVTEDDKWVKNDDDTWTYTFDVFDDEEEYYMFEESMDGYEAIYSENINVNGVVTKSGIIENKSTNTGDLKIYKSVVNGSSADRSREFEVTLQLHASDSKLVEGVHQFGDVIFVNGIAKVGITNQNSPLVISDLPVYYTVTATETPTAGFDITSVSVNRNNSLVAEGENGSVTTDLSSEHDTNIYYTNTRTVPVNGSFTVKKVGEQYVSGNFTFNVSMTGLMPNETYSFYGPSLRYFTADAAGNAQVQVVMSKGSSFSISNLPITTKYSVEEESNEYIASYDVTTRNSDTVITNSHDENIEPYTSLSTKYESVGTTTTFTNSTGEEEQDDVADIKLIKKDRQTGNVLNGAVFLFEGTTDIGDEISISRTSDSNGEFVFKDIPNGEYTLRETKAPEGYALDSTIRAVKVVNGHPMYYGLGTIGPVIDHSANQDDDENVSGQYGTNLRENKVITVPGAKRLTVKITYGFNSYGDYIVGWSGSHPEYTSYSQSGYFARLSGSGKHTASGHTQTYTVSGDTITLLFYTDGSSSTASYYDNYGYRVEITGYDPDRDLHELSIQGLGKDGQGIFVVNNNASSLASFELEKVSSVNAENKLYGALFSLENNNGEVIARESSDKNGIAKFVNLTPGVYTLNEVDAPTGYTKTNEVYTVTVTSDNTVTISDSSGSAIIPVDGKYQIENIPQPVDLNIKKTVVGAMGDKNKDFDFTVHVEKTAPGDYVIEKSSGESETVTVGSNGIADIPVSVKHNQTATIKGLSYNAEVVVTEPSSEYFAGYTVTTGTRVINSRSNQEANTELSTQEIILDGDYTVEYMNSLDGVVPTGMEQTKKNLMILFFALSIVFVAILRKIRKDAGAK